MKQINRFRRMLSMLLVVFMFMSMPGVLPAALADEPTETPAVTQDVQESQTPEDATVPEEEETPNAEETPAPEETPAEEPEVEDWGLSGNVLQLTTTGDTRVKLTEFGDLADGTYEVTFMVPENDTGAVPGNVGFLARYVDEGNYAGLSIDYNTGWESHYSRGLGSGRGNVVLMSGNIEDGVVYRVRVTYSDATVSVAYMTEGDTEFTKVGTDTLTGNYYDGEGGFAIRLSAGNTGCNTILVDNIVQKDLNGEVRTTMDFEDVTDGSEIDYTAKINNTNNDGTATLTVVDMDAEPEEPEPVDPEAVLDEAEAIVKAADYTAEASDEAAAEAAAKAIVAALDLGDVTAAVSGVSGSFVAAVAGTEEDPDGTNGSYEFMVALTIEGATTRNLSLALTIPAKAYEAPPEPEAPTDPGLSDAVMEDGDDDYTQNLSDTTSISGGEAVNINQAFWGMDGTAVQLSTSGDTRVKLTDVPALQDGAYEISFRTGDSVPTSLGILPRYLDESNYIGFSIDGGGSNWTIHYSTGSNRHNTSVDPQPEVLQPNTTYKMKLTFTGTTVQVQYMKDGDTAYRDVVTYQLNSSGYTGAEGGFAVRAFGGSPVTLDNLIQYNTAGEVTYKMDFNDGKMPTFSAQSNRGAMGSANSSTSFTGVEIPASEEANGFTAGRATMIEAAAGGVYVDASAPTTDAPTYTVQLAGTGSAYGLVFNYADADNYAAIWYDGVKWLAGGKVDGEAVAATIAADANLPELQANEARTFRLEQNDAGEYLLTISAGPVEGATTEDAVTYNLGALDGIYTGAGKVGVYAAEAMTLYAGPIEVIYLLTATVLPDPAEGSYLTLKSDEMQVLVGSSFPHIYTYKDLNGTSLAYGTLVGSEVTSIYVDTAENLYDATEDTNSWALCTTTSNLTGSTDSTATYEIIAVNEEANVNATFTVTLTVEGKTLRMDIPSVVEADGSATVRAFQFGNNPFLTLAGLGVGGALGVVDDWGPTSDLFVALKGAASNETYQNFTYGMFYDTASGVSASVENNAENGKSKYILTQNVTGTPYLSLNSASWAWQYYDEIDPEDEEKPYFSVVIGGDENSDGEITWQDAGVAYRDIMELPYGYENTKNEWMFIAMNMSSQASQPFLRVLDLGKAMSYLTDGFGMKIMNKGYQVSGHDDSHGDYDFAGLQQGGADEFNTLINVGLEYGIKNGVHANATEFALDGFDTVLANMRGIVTGGVLQKNWNWFDQAFLVDKNKDVWSGALAERIQEFDEALPNLDFVYLDVYQAGSRYKASQLVKYFNGAGITMGTEALGDLNQDITFVHWNTDMYYATGGTQSEVGKFVTHGVGDLNAPDKAILGSLMPGIADWRNTNRFSDGVDVFYRNNLPTKYLQHFELLSWEPSQKAVFSDNVESTVNGDITTITKDGKTIAVLDTSTVLYYDEYPSTRINSNGYPQSPASAEIFIPWSPEVEDKIYAYSDSGNFGTWDVPDSWAGVTTAYLYELTTTGREFVGEVTVTNGQVTLDLESGVPYVLTKEAKETAHRYDVDGSVLTNDAGETVYLPTLEEHPYGEGTLFEDPGFTSLSIEPWTVTGNADAAVVAQDQYEQAMLWLKLDFEGSVGQTVTVEPGKTYSISVWVNSAGDRPVTLTVTAGDVTESTSIDTTADHTVNMKPSKFTGMSYQRLNLDITIPENVTSATVALSTVAGTNEIYVDDFRSWVWTDLTGAENPGPAPEAEEYYYYEDFEHVDEGWGPFVSNVNNQPYVNLAYKNPDATEDDHQIKDYVIDGLTSLKGQQRDNFGTDVGGGNLIMRTEPATLNFETGHQYLVEFDYETYFEYQTTAGGAPGKNGPLNDETYFLIDVRKSDGTIISTYTLEPNEFDQEYLDQYVYADGAENNTDPESYNVHPATKTLSFMVDATTEKDIYLTFRLSSNSNLEGNPVFAIDNFRVTQDPAPTVSVSGPEVATNTGWYDYIFNLSGVAEFDTLHLVYTVDDPSGVINGNNPVALNGFVRTNFTSTTNADGSVTYEAILVYDPASAEAPSLPVDVFNMSLRTADEGSGSVTVKLDGATCAYQGGSAVTVEVDEANGSVTTQVTWNVYDVNGDGAVDIGDVSAVRGYYQVKEGDANWDAAKICDVNGDGTVDMEDLVEVGLAVLNADTAR